QPTTFPVRARAGVPREKRGRTARVSALALLAERALARPHVLRDRALGHLRAGHQRAEAGVEGVDVLASQVAGQAHQRGPHLADRQLALLVAEHVVEQRRAADDLGEALLLLAEQ